jgi:hypothetical protein
MRLNGRGFSPPRASAALKASTVTPGFNATMLTSASRRRALLRNSNRVGPAARASAPCSVTACGLTVATTLGGGGAWAAAAVALKIATAAAQTSSTRLFITPPCLC